MIFFYIVAALVGMFILLGVLSQKGEPAGLLDGRLQEPGNKPNTVCSEDGTQPERAVKPLSASLTQVADVIEATGGTITSRSDDYLSATYMSKIFKFVDDVEVRRDGDICHIRSASRVGYSDRGINRKRVSLIRSHLSAKTASDT